MILCHRKRAEGVEETGTQQRKNRILLLRKLFDYAKMQKEVIICT